MRVTITLLTLVAGVAIALVSYFLLAAPLGVPTEETFSNPRMPFAGGLFALGILVAFAAAIVYEVLPETTDG